MSQKPDPEQFLAEYRKRTDSNLVDTAPCLRGNAKRDPIAAARLEAVMQVIQERRDARQGPGGGILFVPQKDEAPEASSAPADKPGRTFDEYLAWKYTEKLRNARARGLDFTLTLNDMRKLLKAKRCAYTGALFVRDAEHRHPYSRTIERVDSRKGYTRENCLAVCYAANMLKNAVLEDPDSETRLTPKELARMGRVLRRKL